MKKTIKWTMPDENMIKFVEDSTPIEYTDAVKKFMESSGISDGDVVAVEIDEQIGDNGTVVKISKNGSEKVQTKPEVKKPVVNDYDSPPETKKVSKEENKTVVNVKGISFKNKGIIFEGEEKWYSFTEEVENTIKQNNVSKGSVVEIIFEKRAKGNDLITKMNVENKVKKETVTEGNPVEVKTEVPVQAKQTQYVDARQGSIEAQACINAANATVSRLFAGTVSAKTPEDGTLIKTLITSLAKHNYDLLQELKNK